MLKNILNTVASKVLNGILLFVLVLLTTHYLGTSGRGIVSLVTAAVGILGMVNGFVGGQTLVYLFPRHRSRAFFIRMMTISAAWALLTSLLGGWLMLLMGMFEPRYFAYVILLGAFSCLTTTGSMILIGEEQIMRYNLILLLQALLNVAFFSCSIFVLKFVSEGAYLLCLVLANFAVFILLGFFVLRIWNVLDSSEEPASLRETSSILLRLSLVAQVGSLIQYLNYRLSYFLMNRYLGPSEVGVYSIGVMLSEAIWLISGSIALVQYARIASLKNDAESVRLTVQLSKLSFLLTLGCVLALLVVPKELISVIFGRDFSQVHLVVLSLSVGIASFGFASVLSHYFAGMGKYHVNTLAALVGFAVTIAGNLLLIPPFGYVGAGATASLSYFVTTLFLLVVFKRTTRIGLEAFIPVKRDFEVMIQLTKSTVTSWFA